MQRRRIPKVTEVLALAVKILAPVYRVYPTVLHKSVWYPCNPQLRPMKMSSR